MTFFAAFLLAGAALRPRGSAGRGVVLGATTYLATGLVTMVIITALLHGSMLDLLSEPLSTLFFALLWPGMIAGYAAGYIGR
jgi:hypothetical protein